MDILYDEAIDGALAPFEKADVLRDLAQRAHAQAAAP